jgi:hypothetical protein
MQVIGQGHALVALPPPPRKRPAPLYYRRLGGLQSRSGQVRKISPPPGFDPQTVQLVASRYTQHDILGPTCNLSFVYFNICLFIRKQRVECLITLGTNQAARVVFFSCTSYIYGQIKFDIFVLR